MATTIRTEPPIATAARLGRRSTHRLIARVVGRILIYAALIAVGRQFCCLSSGHSHRH